MTTLTTRSGKGSALTHAELDANFDKVAQAKVGTYTVLVSDNRDTIECSGTFTVSLPDVATVLAASDTGDFEVTIKNTGAGVITVGRITGADTIDGTAANEALGVNIAKTYKANKSGNGYLVLNDLKRYAGGSYTTASLATSGTDRTDVVHGLGTDDIDYGYIAYGNDATVDNKFLIGSAMYDLNCGLYAIGASGSSQGITTLPSTGNLRIDVNNNASVAQTITVNWWARVR